jgi:hypothetical protein
MIVSGEDLISVTLLASSNILILFVFINSISAEKKIFLFLCNKRKENFYLLIITSESSIIEQFSLEFILRRFDGDAPSTIIDTELARLAVGVKVIGLIVVCCCC